LIFFIPAFFLNHLNIRFSLFSFWLGLIFLLNSSCKQELPYQLEEISEESELNFAFPLKEALSIKMELFFM
jgi:hypothetical protein